MDFEGLFWIALIVFYFMSRVLGGKKRSKPSSGPTGERRPRPERSRPSSSTSEPQLDEALREIRRALGFPVDEPEPKPQNEAEPEPASELEKQRARRTAEMERRREQDTREVNRRREQDAREMARQRDRSTPESARQRKRDARELARQQEMLERAREADKKKAPAIPKPEVARRPGPIGAHPMESSFGEEEMFEVTGRHPHEVAPTDSTLQAPYAAKPEQRSPLHDRLRGKASLREAFVLKEVLDKPLSLRGRR